MAALSGSDARPAVVVIGLDCITGLQTARLLAARGVPVIGIAADRNHFCARTRVPLAVHEAPTSGERLVRALERLAPRLPAPGTAVLVPCTDAAVLTISAARDRLAGAYRFVLPEHDLLEALTDKVRFVELAHRHDLPIPETRILRSRDDAEAAAAALVFPAVVKPPIKSAEWLANARAKVVRVDTAEDLVPAWERLSAWSPELIAQSWVEGGEDSLYSCNAYFDRDGTPLATFVARKIRQWPPDVGTSSLGVEVRDDRVLDATLQLFAAVGYRGLAYLEVKRDATSGQYAIIEPNLGRPTGRSSIAERGGVELLMTAYCDALGLPLPDARTQRYGGAKWIYWRHDLQAAAVRMRRGELTPRGWLESVRGRRIEAVASLHDPVPFLADITTVAARGVSVAARRLRGRRASAGVGSTAVALDVTASGVDAADRPAAT